MAPWPLRVVGAIPLAVRQVRPPAGPGRFRAGTIRREACRTGDRQRTTVPTGTGGHRIEGRVPVGGLPRADPVTSLQLVVLGAPRVLQECSLGSVSPDVALQRGSGSYLPVIFAVGRAPRTIPSACFTSSAAGFGPSQVHMKAESAETATQSNIAGYSPPWNMAKPKRPMPHVPSLWPADFPQCSALLAEPEPKSLCEGSERFLLRDERDVVGGQPGHLQDASRTVLSWRRLLQARRDSDVRPNPRAVQTPDLPSSQSSPPLISRRWRPQSLALPECLSQPWAEWVKRTTRR